MGYYGNTWAFNLFLLLGMTLLSLTSSNAQGTTGEFISIDCGSSVNYTDALGIQWSTDVGYVTTGQNEVVETASAKLGQDAAQNVQKLTTIRTFPGVMGKQCYVIPEVYPTQLYVVRVSFLGTNFTNTQNNVTFGITMSNYYWTNVTIADSSTLIVNEAYFVTGSSTFSLCLIRISGVPFISSLELRLLPSYVYQSISYPELVYNTVFRWDCGGNPLAPSVRYPVDPYDRVWTPVNLPSVQSISNATAALKDGYWKEEAPPVSVLQTAWTVPLPGPISIYQNVSTQYSLFVPIMYFAEVLSVPASSKRELTVFLDDQKLSEFEVSSNVHQFLNWTIIYSDSPINITIEPASNSTLGAILNAIEAFGITLNTNANYSTSIPDIAALGAIKTSFNLTEWTGDPCLPVPWDWVQCTSQTVDTIIRVLQINLADYNLTGAIPEDIQELTELTDLSLNNNNLSGEIYNLTFPPKLRSMQLQSNNFYGQIPSSLGALSDLRLLNLDNNLFSGAIPQTILSEVQLNNLEFSATGNPSLCLSTNSVCGASPVPSPTPSVSIIEGNTSNKSSSPVGIIVGAIAAGVVVLVLVLVLAICCCYRRPKPIGTSDTPPGTSPVDVKDYSHQSGIRFSLLDVKSATNNFSKVIGEGGFGTVYYGQLPDGQEMAVKVNKVTTINGQATEEFLNEVELLSRVHHVNLVSLLGYCDELGQQILVYSYMSEGSLYDHLHSENQVRIALDWKTRVEIALHAARGLEYLHNSSSPPIIHRDVKSSNILLTDRLMAKVADFGISRVTNADDSHGVLTEVKGTHGYLDPEYFIMHRLTPKSDVYSFGVVLLELITGRLPMETNFSGRAGTLQDWVRESVQDGNIHAVMDPQLGGNYNLESIWKVVELALLSIDRRGVRRPDMQEIVRGLTDALELQVQHIQMHISMHSPSHLPASDYDAYQRVHERPPSRGSRGSRSSNDSVATYSWRSNVTAR